MRVEPPAVDDDEARGATSDARPAAGEALRAKAAGFAVHLALLEALRVLAPRDPDAAPNPLGPAGDAARRALRRAWVATHSALYDTEVEEPDRERAMLALWTRDEADGIRSADVVSVSGPPPVPHDHAPCGCVRLMAPHEHAGFVFHRRGCSG